MMYDPFFSVLSFGIGSKAPSFVPFVVRDGGNRGGGIGCDQVHAEAGADKQRGHTVLYRCWPGMYGGDENRPKWATLYPIGLNQASHPSLHQRQAHHQPRKPIRLFHARKVRVLGEWVLSVFHLSFVFLLFLDSVEICSYNLLNGWGNVGKLRFNCLAYIWLLDDVFRKICLKSLLWSSPLYIITSPSLKGCSSWRRLVKALTLSSVRKIWDPDLIKY